MSVKSARLTLKQHRFEISAVVVASLAVAVAGAWFKAQLLAVNVPKECFDAFGGPSDPSVVCGQLVQSFAAILTANSAWFDPAVGVLPLAAGVLVGVPIVAGELDSGTAQTAWSLSPARWNWLVRQMWPLVIVGGAAVAIAAVSASSLHETRMNSFPPTIFAGLGFHGPLVVARALVAFGLGLLSGSILGRPLPAVIVSSSLCMALIAFAAIGTREAWLRDQPGELINLSTEHPVLLLEQFFRSPDGVLLSEDDAYALMPVDVDDPEAWLSGAGYVRYARAITAENAAEWERLEIAGTTLLGLGLTGLTFPIVSRRRPT